MKSAHTPGPWQVFYMPASSDTDDEHHFALVANKNKSTFDENNSNARLMAAAPDLLEALQRLHSPNPPLYSGDFVKGVMAERQRIVNLLMIQHDMAKDRHNYWQVAAQLIQADVASDT